VLLWPPTSVFWVGGSGFSSKAPSADPGISIEVWKSLPQPKMWRRQGHGGHGVFREKKSEAKPWVIGINIFNIKYSQLGDHLQLWEAT